MVSALLHGISLRYSSNSDCWEVAHHLAGREVRFSIAGGDAPDVKLVERAIAIVEDFGRFHAVVEAFLLAEARAVPELADEIATLDLEAVTLAWPDRPDEGMLWFSGPDDSYRVWRCDYVDGKPIALGFDD